ncbi:MAG: DNA mismatch repair endonuclease MutL [Candidatus Thorarchaeota archaeon]
MSKIKMLSEDMISLISAGEVIENPSSIVKELIENSLDAGADMIDVEIRSGGIDFISVSDNGSGILREDCTICLKRYSTSKVSSKEDLDEIATYGFRGEALASIASVADIRISTQTNSEELGTLVVSRVGEEPQISDASRPQGTTVEVHDLFKKIPARRKHLQSPKVESVRIQEVVMKQAAISTEIGFRFIRDANVAIDCPPNQTSAERILSIWGADIARALVDVNYSEGDIKVTGFVARPPVARGNRSREYFSVAKRPITDERLSLSVERAYATTLMKGQFPVCALDISLSLASVDVNVHPTKREVRILDIENVLMVVKMAVIGALGFVDSPVETVTLESSLGESLTESVSKQEPEPIRENRHQDPLEPIPLVERMMLQPPGEVDTEEVNALGGVFKIIGQMHNLYILLEFEDGLLIVDQHAAHERVLYERLRKDVNSETVDVQELLEPFILKLNPSDVEQILDMSDELERLGYTVSEFGGSDISVSTLPEVLGRIASEIELVTLMDQMLTVGKTEARESFMDHLVKVTACHSAVRAGQSLNHDEIREIILDLSKTKSKYNCAHGRPAMIKIHKEDLDRTVGRLGADAIKRYRVRHRLD